MKKLAVIITHPIQYYAPIFKLLNDRGKLQIKVFYTWEQSIEKIYDVKFGKEIKWDIPLLEGYDYNFSKNVSKKPGSVSFMGVINPTLIKEIKTLNPDAILVFGWNHLSHFKVMRYFKGKIPVYFRGDSTLIDEKQNIKTIIRRIILKLVYNYVDYAFYVGSENKKYFLKHGLHEEQLIFAPHAVDNDRFSESSGVYENKALLWKNNIGIPDHKIVFLFVGKFEPKKDPLLLIQAAKAFPEYLFLFVGNGDLEREMNESAGENVIFLPFQNQSHMPVVYRLGNIFVLPSKGPGETWGLAVNEAMACDRAVLVSNKVGCANDLVRNNENGYIFESQNLNDLIDKIKLSAINYHSFGKRSKEIIVDWNFSKIANALESLRS
jgi:glycosyltransferase involved in cell wall biosynthesis